MIQYVIVHFKIKVLWLYGWQHMHEHTHTDCKENSHKHVWWSA